MAIPLTKLSAKFGRKYTSRRQARLRWLALTLILLLQHSLLLALEQSVAPGINTPYHNADPEQWRDVFESEGREIWDRRQDILSALNLKPGMDLADIGAGTGFFSLMFAEQVGESGKVYAVDITPSFIDAIRLRAQSAGINNLIGIVNDPRSVRLEPDSIDLAFISDTYHHFEYPQSTLESIHRALRDGGELVIVDFKLIPGASSSWVNRHVRAGQEQVTEEVEAAGFEMIEHRPIMRTQYFLRFRKVSSAPHH